MLTSEEVLRKIKENRDRGDKEFLLDILEACNRIIDFTKDMSYNELQKT